jgi:hypothetical protein
LIAVHPDDLQAVGAAILHVADPRADFRRTSRAALADDRVDEHAGRDDPVRVALGLPHPGLVEIAADFPRRRHARRQIEIALVLDGLRHARLTLLVPVHVRVHDARHHVLAGAVDETVGASRHLRAGCGDEGDASVLDDDVGRAGGRASAAIDHHGVADDETARLLRVNGRRSR